MKKVVSFENIEEVIGNLKTQGKTVVLTNGCFDILHIGHARYLSKAKELGDILVIGINSDSSVKKLKGENRPLNNESDRAELMSYFAFVDYVVIFSDQTADNLILKVKPDLYAKGGDYTMESLPEAATLEKVGAKGVFINFVEGYSTTKIIENFKK